MDTQQLRRLLAQYFDNTISRSDCELLLQHLDESDSAQLSAIIDDVLKVRHRAVPFEQAQQTRIYSRLAADISKRREITPRSRSTAADKPFARWARIAALWLAAIATALWLHLQFNSAPSLPQQAAATIPDDIVLPDDNQAVLTLADGKALIVRDSMHGVLANQAGVTIRLTADGSIQYESTVTHGTHTAKVPRQPIPYNTFSTPKGHSHRLILPDGTPVWLNTASAIRFPVQFTGSERIVTLVGEAYFEVAHDETKPFRVLAEGSTIQVLGTHFNVSAYTDDTQVVTTLLEGAVNVSKNGQHIALRPGEQAIVDGRTGRMWQSTADTQSVMAWKNGYFRFDNESIESIINKVSKWYDIEKVAYHGQFGDRFTGTFQRSKSITQLFDHLEQIAPIKFKIEGKEVVIMK